MSADSIHLRRVVKGKNLNPIKEKSLNATREQLFLLFVPKNRQRKTFWCFFLACLPLCRCVSAFPPVPSWAVRAVFVQCLARPLPCRSLFSSFLVGAVPKTGNGISGVHGFRHYLCC